MQLAKWQSKLEMFREIGRVYSKVVLFLIIGNLIDSVRLEVWSK